MKEFANKVEIFPVAEIPSSNIFPWDMGAGHLFYTDDVLFTPTPSVSDAGKIYSINMDLILNEVDIKEVEFFSMPRKSIVFISDDDGIKYQVGDRYIPVFVHISKYLNRAKLYIEGKTVCLPFK